MSDTTLDNARSTKFSPRGHPKPYLYILAAIPVVVLFKSIFSTLFLFFSGVLFSMGTYLYLSLFIDLPSVYTNPRYARDIQHKLPRLAFSVDSRGEDHLFEELEGMLQTKGLQELVTRPIFDNSFLISEALDQLLELIISNFVTSWYKSISKTCLDTDDVFVDHLKLCLQEVTKKLQSRLGKIDYPGLAISHILPIATDHFNSFLAAEEAVKGKALKLQDPHDVEISVAMKYNRGHTHPAVGFKNKSAERAEHLRKKIDQVLPLLLATTEVNCHPVRILVRELLSNVVLLPALSMAIDPDFYNQLIVKVIGAGIQERDQVEKVRATLDEHATHTLKAKRSMLQLNPQKMNSAPDTLRIEKDMDDTAYQNVISIISKSTSLFFLKELKTHLKQEISTCDTNIQSNEYYFKKLFIINQVVEERLATLTGDEVANQSVDSRKDADLSAIPTEADENFLAVLKDPQSVKSFSEYMNHKGRGVLLKYWVAVDTMRNPLEDRFEEGESGSELEMTDEQAVFSGTMTSSEMESTRTQIAAIFTAFIAPTASRNILRISQPVYEVIQEFTKSSTSSGISKAKGSLFTLQRQVYVRMKVSDFKMFQKSREYQRIFLSKASQSTVASKKRISTLDSPTKLCMTPGIPSLDNGISENVLKAVEAALNEIMCEKSDVNSLLTIKKQQDHIKALNSSRRPLSHLSSDSFPNLKVSASTDLEMGFVGSTSNPVLDAMSRSDDSLKKSLFAEDGPQSTEMTDSDYSEMERSRNSILFSDELHGSLFEDYDPDSDDPNFIDGIALDESSIFAGSDNGERDANDLLLAGPGNLSLTEEIVKLNDDIERLNEQLTILEPMLKKAELTNNVLELRILRKSKSSLHREIQIKDLQRQQFIVQENDNSLYGKSKVKIQSFIKDADGSGKRFYLYIIEVQKLTHQRRQADLGSAEKGETAGEDKITAGWIVARRFSQFYQLNEYLKKLYPSIANIKFPGKKVVMRFQEKQLVEMRKHKLEAYLQELLKYPEVCQNRVFRLFLSSEVFERSSSKNGSSKNKPMAHSTSSRVEVESVVNKLYNNYFSLGYTNGLSVGDISLQNGEQVKDLQMELNSYEDSDKVGGSFVKPICDLLTSIFRLNDKNNGWLRGRAVLVLLQQILGSTIEKTCKEKIGTFFTSETKILDNITSLKTALFPHNKFRESGPPRTTVEKSNCRLESRVLLESMVVDSCGKIFGRSNSKWAGNKVFDMLQNELLNTHLVFEIFDEILDEVFPELKESRS